MINRLPNNLRSNDDAYLVTYCNAFDAKMSYHLRDKEPQNLREAFKAALNIERNRRESSKVRRRDEVNILKNPKHDKGSTNKGSCIEEKFEKVLNSMKDVNNRLDKHEKGLGNDKPHF